MDTTQPAYSALFVFGDSLSDNGAVFALTGGLIPPAQITGTNLAGDTVDFDALGIAYDQKFTNGDVYADVSAGLLGIASDTSTFYDDFSGSNFAVGGGTATDLSAFGETANSSFADQMAAFQAAVAGLPGTQAQTEAFLQTAAASVFIGLNDGAALTRFATASGAIDQAAFASGIQTILAEYAAQARALASTGVGTIILNTLPGGSFFPSTNAAIDAFGPGTAEFFDGLGAQINAGIQAIGVELALGGTAVEIVDFFSLAKEVQADQETFGFLSLENVLLSGDAENTLLIEDIPIARIGFLDPVHFTAELHEVFGAFQAKTLGNAQINGSEAGDVTRGTDGDDTIFTLGGTDLIFAGAGDDLVFGGADRDLVLLGDGHDIGFGGTGNDVLLGQAGDDILSGGSGHDYLLAGDGSNVLVGNLGNDVLLGGDGVDILIGGAGNDAIAGRGGDDIAIWRASEVTQDSTDENHDLFLGGAGNDTLLLVSDAPITDIDAFLAAENIRLSSVENVLAITEAELQIYDFGTVGTQMQMADLFGLM